MRNKFYFTPKKGKDLKRAIHASIVLKHYWEENNMDGKFTEILKNMIAYGTSYNPYKVYKKS